MGAVYEAEHLSIARRVAIKVLHASCSHDPESLARFYNEARAANLIDHPSVVQVLDYGRQDDGSSYFVMELLKGETLRSRIDRSQPGVPVGEALRIGRQAASTLAAAHDCGIVHRDLKPENIMLVPDPEATDGQRVKILDFGIAKLAQWVDAAEVRTRTNMIVGTPAYMAPEQCRGAALVDERADVYSLGVVLFELLAGRRPFLGGSAGEYMGQHLFCEPPALDTVTAGIPSELAALIATLLGKDREVRPRMAQVLTSLEEMCAACRASEDDAGPARSTEKRSLPPRTGVSKEPPGAGRVSPEPGSPARPLRSLAPALALGCTGILGFFVARGEVHRALRTQRTPPEQISRVRTEGHAAAAAAAGSVETRMSLSEGVGFSRPLVLAPHIPEQTPSSARPKAVLPLKSPPYRAHDGANPATNKRRSSASLPGARERGAAVSVADPHPHPSRETKNNEILED